MNSSTLNIAVLGGGLLGRLNALALAREGFRVSLFDKGTPQGEQSAAFQAAAMLAPLAESLDSPPEIICLGQQSMALWRELINSLPEKPMMQENGSLIVWHPQDKALSQHFAQHLQRTTGMHNPMQRWQSNDIAQYEPQLAGRFGTGFYLPYEGQLDGRQILLSLNTALMHHHAACHWQQTRTPSDLYNDFDFVLDCRGYGAKNDWNRLPENNHLRGVRGEVARVFAPEITLNRPIRLLHPRYPLYIAPKENHVFVVGATQIESESQTPCSVRSGLELLSALYAIHPAFGEASILELGVGLRPTLMHHKPEIRYNLKQGLIEINGLFRHGFLIAPAVTSAALRLLKLLASGSNIPECDDENGLPYIKAA
ncbi:MAG: FAD-dependent oxidoreductase [Alysiella sp.]|uniref:FAD-dependent oxidoreductase n=1 Tax=Alysiella sp. TaxID=1872483 RepID=UPI0026DB8D7F|nr:FAD-dependent oxidoreductase [Alysiella sp.]MDO4433378.1 FAD-dependent oxidoreductase [Alysiella sp.]